MGGKAFLELLDRCVSDGALEIVIDGETVRVGRREGPAEAVVRVTDPRFLDQVLTYGNLALGEAYVRGDFSIDGDDVAAFIGVLLRNRLDAELGRRLGLAMALKMAAIRLTNRLAGRRRAIAAHYDKEDDSLFEAFLDPRMLYSCGYVCDPDAGLERFQQDKLERICEKLRLASGERLLDIGCGYGGLLIYAAERYGISGKGITLGRRHCERARANVAAAGLANRIEIELQPYEEVTGRFEKVVSVGMMEHLRRSEYRRFTEVVSRALTEDGMGLFHYIGCNGPDHRSDPFVQKHIFPGAHWPKLSTIAHWLEQSSLGILDVENLVRHYSLTLKAWLENFRRAYPSLDHQRYDEPFRRLWEYYLGCAIAASLNSQVALYQILFTKDYSAPIPYQRV